MLFNVVLFGSTKITIQLDYTTNGGTINKKLIS